MSKLFLASTITLGLLLIFATGGVMVLLILVGAVNVTFAVAFTVIIGLISWLIGPFFTDLINKWLYKLKFHTPEEVQSMHPEIYELIDSICKEKGFKFPKIGIIPDDNPTAYTYGSDRWNARLVLTAGIFKYLSTEEAKAVVAHEMGHIVNRDFIVMMIASLLLQILYEIYAGLRRARGRNSGGAKMIALAFYVLYIIGVYLVYYLSRTREYLADAYSATRVAPKHLASALVRIGYGILAAGDTANSQRLLNSTRHLGIVDVKNAKHVGATAALAHDDVRAISEVMAFDCLSPWAKLIELSSTHPLTGKRLMALEKISQDQGKTDFPYDIDTAVAGTTVDRSKLWKLFFRDLTVVLLPWILGIVSAIFLPVAIFPAAVAIGLIVRLIYKYPRGASSESTILNEMRNPYASPVRGKLVSLSGNVIGRGQPGYVFSEDMMMQDSTGIIFLNYSSLFAWVGNIFFALTRVKQLIGKSVTATGWFFRHMGSSLSLKEIRSEEGGTIKSHPMLWSFVLPVILLVWSGYLYAGGYQGTGLDYFTSSGTSYSTPSSGWKEYSDSELNVSFSYPDDFTVKKMPKDGGTSGKIVISYQNTPLVTILEQSYSGTISSYLESLRNNLEAQYVKDSIKWDIKNEEAAKNIYYLYPVSGNESAYVNPIFYEIDDYGDGKILQVLIAYESLNPSVKDDVYKIGDSLVTVIKK